MHVVGFTPVVPFPGIPHAGGEYVLLHAEALIGSGHRVTLIAPETSANRAARDLAPAGVGIVLVPGDPAPDLRCRLRPALPSRSWERAATSSPTALSALRTADLVEYQWTQTAHMHARLRHLVPGVPAVCIAHDAVSQLAERQAGLAERTLERLARRVRARLVRADERRILERMATTVTFSDKDRDLLERLHRTLNVQVVAPPLEPVDPRWAEPRGAQPGNVVFIGAFDRQENADAADWLVEKIWPRVVGQVPEAVLELVGANPTARMSAAADGNGSIRVTGYTEDLVPVYQRAAVAVVPLRRGAGVKFKTVTALLWGVPVVATGVGVEGIATAESGVFGAVSDDAEGLAAGIVEMLRDGAEARRIGDRGRSWATTRYGRRQFADALDTLYRSLVDGPAASR